MKLNDILEGFKKTGALEEAETKMVGRIIREVNPDGFWELMQKMNMTSNFNGKNSEKADLSKSYFVFDIRPESTNVTLYIYQGKDVGEGIGIPINDRIFDIRPALGKVLKDMRYPAGTTPPHGTGAYNPSLQSTGSN
jgi:hypothetical protein